MGPDWLGHLLKNILSCSSIQPQSCPSAHQDVSTALDLGYSRTSQQLRGEKLQSRICKSRSSIPPGEGVLHPQVRLSTARNAGSTPSGGSGSPRDIPGQPQLFHAAGLDAVQM